MYFLSIDTLSVDVDQNVKIQNNTFNGQHHEIIFLGIDRESNPICVRVVDYMTSCYVALPTVVNQRPFIWTKSKVDGVIDYVKSSLDRDNHSPTSHAFVRRELFYDYKVSDDPNTPMLALFFRSVEALRHAKNRFHNKECYFPIIDKKLTLLFYEWDVSPTRKYLTLLNATYSQWLMFDPNDSIVADPNSANKPITRFYEGREYLLSWKSITSVPFEESDSFIVHPRILSFDLETYSSNYLQFPQATKATDVLYLNAIVYQQYNKRHTRRIFVTYFGDEPLHLPLEGVKFISLDPSDIPFLDLCLDGDEEVDTNIVYLFHVGSEGEKGRVYISLIAKLRPQIITGYNIYVFDNPYFDTRIKSFGFDVSTCGSGFNSEALIASHLSWSQEANTFEEKIISHTKTYKGVTDMYEDEWSSSGAGNNIVTYLTIPGIITLDLLPWTKRQKTKLELYNLDFVSKLLLGRGKHPVKAERQFEIYDMYRSKAEGFEEAMQELILYCAEDATLVLDLFEHSELDVWTNVLEMSRATGVSILDVLTRGQSPRIVSLVYDAVAKRKPTPYVVDFRNVENHIQVDESYKGGYVGTEEGIVPGLYEDCFVYDYSSLYPSIMIRYNLCQSTFIPSHKRHMVDKNRCYIHTVEKLDGTKNDVWFAKEDLKAGIIPSILRQLTMKRTLTRKKLAEESNPLLKKALDCRQLQIKVVSNSFYGTWGVTYEGARLPLNEGAQFVTGKGQEIIINTAKYLKEEHGCHVIYGDTDSVFVRKVGMPILDLIPFARELEKKVSSLFGDPLKVELEKICTMLLVTKKRYAYLPYDINPKSPNYGKLKSTDAIVTKGLVSARRDNCRHQRETFDKVKSLILTNSPMEVVLDVILKSILKMLNDELPLQDYQLVRTMGRNYKSASYMLAVFRDCLTARGRRPTPGERLAYVVVNPNIYVDSKEQEAKVLGEKMRLIEEYEEGTEEIDIMYYIEHNMQKCLEQMFGLAYQPILLLNENRQREESYKKVLSDLIKCGYKTEINKALIQTKKELCYHSSTAKDSLPVYYNTLNLLWMKVKPPPQKVGEPLGDLRTRDDKRFASAISKHRAAHVTGKHVFDIYLNSHPIKMIVGAAKRDRRDGTNLCEQVFLTLSSKSLLKEIGYE